MVRHGLFEGWGGSARAIQAESRFREAELALAERARRVSEEVTALWFAYRRQAAQREPLRERVRMTGRALEAHAQEPANGPAAILSRLAAERAHRSAALARSLERLATQRALVALAIGVGDDPVAPSRPARAD
jgi:outer membrane protein TolC